MSASDTNICPDCGGEQASLSVELAFCHLCRFPLKLIAGKYKLQKQLSEGGFGTVYLAYHTRLVRDKERAIKVIKPDVFAKYPTMAERFEREVQMTATLSQHNPHIVRIYDDFGEEPGIGHFYVMEFLKGAPLLTCDGNAAAEPSTHDPQSFLIFYQLCKALAAAHQEGIVHRDLKPDNIFLTQRKNGRLFVKLIDFGIARPTELSENQITKGALGTPLYMSPEQCLNQAVGPFSDIYAMGLLLFEMLTGRNAYGFDRPDLHAYPAVSVLTAHLSKEPIALRTFRPDLPEGLEQTILQMLAKKPDERLQRVEDVWARVRQDMAGTLDLPLALKSAEHEGVFLPEIQSDDEEGEHESDDRALVAAQGAQVGFQDTAIATDTTIHESHRKNQQHRSIPLGSVAKENQAVQPSGEMIDGKGTSSRAYLFGLLFVVMMLGGGAALWFLMQPSKPTLPMQPAKKRVTGEASQPAPSGVRSGAPRAVTPVVPPFKTSQAADRRAFVPGPARSPVQGRSDAVSAQPKKPAARPRTRRTKTRSPTARRRALGRHVALCGALPSGMRWVIGQLRKPARGTLQIKWPGRGSYRIVRKGATYCLALPAARAKVEVRVLINGFQSCRHGIARRHHRLAWTLKFEDPDAIPNEFYPCVEAR